MLKKKWKKTIQKNANKNHRHWKIYRKRETEGLYQDSLVVLGIPLASLFSSVDLLLCIVWRIVEHSLRYIYINIYTRLAYFGEGLFTYIYWKQKILICLPITSFSVSSTSVEGEKNEAEENEWFKIE